MDRRTSLITAAAVGGALLIGSGAVAANIGVLNSAQDDSIGNLTAATAIEVPSSTIDAQLASVNPQDQPANATASTTIVDASDGAPQQFTVETAGSVTVEQTLTGLFVSDVQANDGWNWTTERTGANDLSVTFVSGDMTFEFVASIGADGLMTARVDQPIVNIVQEPATSNGPNDSYENDDDDHDDDDHDDDDHYDDDDHDRDDHEDDGHEDHEGGDDDD